ncbi:MAG: PLP-dependent aminotransferase family protein [Firmicutes bacterium]|nr:PLP-dependent aminotransferase family protein [Bacillota bacterium]
MFNNLVIDGKRPVYLQIKDYLKDLILKGILRTGVRLPSTRDFSAILKVSRNTIILAYQYLEDDGFIHTVKGQGAYVAQIEVQKEGNGVKYDWSEFIGDYAKKASDLDIEKKELRWEKGMISFKSIAPDENLFDVNEFKRAFLNRFSLEGSKLLNYGYARGYKPLIEYLTQYMKNKGVDPEEKELLVTNGFTEGFNLILQTITKPGDRILCENPTHNTAIKIMKLFGLEPVGIPMAEDGLDLNALEMELERTDVKAGFVIPSYHNPTGLVMPLDKRLQVIRIFAGRRIPLIEDGFHEELRYSGTHVAPLLALSGKGNNLIYLGSFSKVLFPGLRIGWIMADRELISYLESVKRSLNIHTSFLDQALLYEYLQSGQFERYLKKARKVYKQRHETAIKLVKEYIPCRKVWGEGGLHIFVELEGLNTREVLARCYQRRILFMPGDIFFTDDSGGNTFRLGISRVKPEEIEEGIKIIGAVVKEMG